jgi:Holliday junction DNA helicase RuvA
MIASVRGRLMEKHPTRVVVETGGVGLDVHVPLPTSRTLGAPGDSVFLRTHLVVREDALTLYGFSTDEERRFFQKLIGVSGIGPKIALSALSGPPLGDLVAALRAGDVTVLTRLPGIGRKTAERMVLELKDGLIEFEGGPAATGRPRHEADAVAALVSLGYGRAVAEKAVARGREQGPEADTVEEMVRRALAVLNSGGKG